MKRIPSRREKCSRKGCKSQGKQSASRRVLLPSPTSSFQSVAAMWPRPGGSPEPRPSGRAPWTGSPEPSPAARPPPPLGLRRPLRAPAARGCPEGCGRRRCRGAAALPRRGVGDTHTHGRGGPEPGPRGWSPRGEPALGGGRPGQVAGRSPGLPPRVRPRVCPPHRHHHLRPGPRPRSRRSPASPGDGAGAWGRGRPPKGASPCLGVCCPAAGRKANLLYMAGDQMLCCNLSLPGTRPPRPLPSSAAPPAPSPAALTAPPGPAV